MIWNRLHLVLVWSANFRHPKCIVKIVQLSKILSPELCAQLSWSLAVRSEQTKKQLRLEILLGDGSGRYKNKLSQDGGKSASHAFPDLTTGIL